MSRPTENDKDQVREGTEALMDIAEEVEAEREASAGKTSLPSDDAEEAAEPPLENPEDEDAELPVEERDVPVNPVVRPTV